ncbi:PREDICTED: lck-interacting transmembrane adapter 1, partial [Nanorana parkeri]|uniref:lck-interacting transmembrane adapter 1 n=1 Tax=Nanorana parkeri TaxID=125878 RepID=UPI000854F77D
MAPRPVISSPSGHILPALFSALGLFLLLCGLCALCKRRRKRRLRNVRPNGVALVDVTLLRQTQLRSLSKSDTRLHEIKRPRLHDPQLRPVSMDPLYHSPNWQCAAAEEDATYSNLTYTPAPLKTSLYECVGSRTEIESVPSVSQEDEVTAEYAVVCKIKKGVSSGVQESRKEKKTQPQRASEEPILPHRPDDLDDLQIDQPVEDLPKQASNLYPIRQSPILPIRGPDSERLPPIKKGAANENAQGSVNAVFERPPQPAYAPEQPEENLYESI